MRLLGTLAMFLAALIILVPVEVLIERNWGMDMDLSAYACGIIIGVRVWGRGLFE